MSHLGQPGPMVTPQPQMQVPAPQRAPGKVEYSPSDLLAVLSELADLLESAKPVLLSKDIRVNRDAALGLINELRGALPVAVEQADDALKSARAQLAAATGQADSLVAAARAEAETIVGQARQRQSEMLEHEAVVSQAKVRAAEILQAARAEGEQLRADADSYCDSRLAQFGNDLAALQTQVAAGRARLAERHPDLGRPISQNIPANAASPTNTGTQRNQGPAGPVHQQPAQPAPSVRR